VSIIGYVLAKVIPIIGEGHETQNVSLALINFSLVAGGGSVAYAVLKQQFLGIRFISRKAVLYGGATLVFAVIYLFVVKPVSDFFGQYSLMSKEAFETGFIILAIIAFQPMLLRIEELLERALLKGKDNLQNRFKELGGEISNVTHEDELGRLLRERLRDILDATGVTLNPQNDDPRRRRLVDVLGRIGEPVIRQDLLKLAEKGKLLNANEAGSADVSSDLSERELARRRLADAADLVGGDEVLVPIIRERNCVGYVALGEKTHGLRYTAEELAQLSVISNQIGVALENIRLLRENVEKKVIEEELQIARRIQSQLLPASSPSIPGYDLSASTIPSRQVGGDYYDFNLLDDALVLVVADVSGKGIPASLLMATLRAAVNSNADVRKNPSTMLRRINALLFGSTSAEEFATLFYGVVNLSDGVMKYANAGHEFPFLVSKDGVHQLRESGIVIGCVENFSYEELSCEIPEGGALVLFTDGITDAATTDGENFGEERLRKALETNGSTSSRELCSNLLSEVNAFAQEGEYVDDLTLVVLKRS
jgi:serine phosphatase RsbU (regulator of sigma subunit)